MRHASSKGDYEAGLNVTISASDCKDLLMTEYRATQSRCGASAVSELEEHIVDYVVEHYCKALNIRNTIC